MHKRLLSVLFALFVAGCGAHYVLVSPGHVGVQNAMSVDPDIAWNRFENPTSSSNHVEVWTQSGLGLDALVFYAGIADGEPLLKPSASKESYAPFHKTMTASEIMDLFEDTFAKSSKTTVTKTRNLRVIKLDGLDGFRFEMSYVLKDEVDRELSAAGAVKDGKLYMIFFEAPKLYYYEHYLPEFDELVATAKING